MSIIDEPKQVTKNRRHFQVDPTIWRLFSDDLTRSWPLNAPWSRYQGSVKKIVFVFESIVVSVIIIIYSIANN